MAKNDVIKEFAKIKGVGKAKAENLYEKGFTSVDKLKKASKKDLLEIDGFSENLVKNVKDHVGEKPEKKEVKKKEEKTSKKEETGKEKKQKVKKPAEKETKKEKTEPKKEKEIEEEKEKEYLVKKKPKLDKEIKEKLGIRKNIKNRTPNFLREEWFRYKRVPKNWRKPDGITSKMRINRKYRPSMARVGFRGPKMVRGLHPSGFKEVLVYNASDLEDIDPKSEAARIGSTVGTKKRKDIEKKAEELDIRILNLRG